MYASSGRSINLLRVGNLRDDEPCPPCDCKDSISVERTIWTDDNIARRFWNCKNFLSAEGPKCKFFMWKDKEMEVGYYKDQLRKMRFELKRKEDFSEVSKVQKKLVKLQQAMEADKQVFEAQLMELMKQNSLLECGIFVMVIVVIVMWLKCP
ncbi:unnamed protein product [Lactuca virosa]|uniref:GRF-type domain-containing protein n=1 Tax=Lactuca virosa TaxID=75947 RepID=A0AAU9PNS7_9ASTR|nr:unnamed protein product [Lactuca virosa]